MEMSQAKEFWLHERSHAHVNPNPDIGIQDIVDLSMGSVLDFGCGFGKLTPYFADYLGVDINQDRVEACQEKFMEKRFDLIESHRDLRLFRCQTLIANNVLHHVDDNEILPMLDSFRICARYVVQGNHVTENGKFPRSGQVTSHNRTFLQYEELFNEAGFHLNICQTVYNPHYRENFHIMRWS